MLESVRESQKRKTRLIGLEIETTKRLEEQKRMPL